MSIVIDLGIFGIDPALIDHVKLEAGDNIELTYDYDHNSIVITAAAPGKTFPGLIEWPALSTITFDAIKADYPCIIHIANNVYAVAYQGPDDHGWVKTFTVDNTTGAIVLTGSSLEFYSNFATYASICHVAGEVYAIAFSNENLDGIIRTISIADDGTTGSVIQSFTFDSTQGMYSSIIHHSGEFFALAYSASAYAGYLRTLQIHSSGDPIAFTDVYGFDVEGRWPSIIKIADTVIAIAYQGPDIDGWLKTFEISATGIITTPSLDYFEFDTSVGTRPSFAHVSGDIYAIAYNRVASGGQLITVTIHTDGQIDEPIVDGQSIDSTRLARNNVRYIRDHVFAIPYEGVDNDGWIKTYTITDAGEISNAAKDSQEFDDVQAINPYSLAIDNDLILIAYKGPGNPGKITCIHVDPPD